MNIQTAPKFEQLEKLKDTRDADLISRKLVDPARTAAAGRRLTRRAGSIRRAGRPSMMAGARSRI